MLSSSPLSSPLRERPQQTNVTTPEETPARKEIRQSQLKSLQQTRYHTPYTQARVNFSRRVIDEGDRIAGPKQRLEFDEFDNENIPVEDDKADCTPTRTPRHIEKKLESTEPRSSSNGKLAFISAQSDDAIRVELQTHNARLTALEQEMASMREKVDSLSTKDEWDTDIMDKLNEMLRCHEDYPDWILAILDLLCCINTDDQRNGAIILLEELLEAGLDGSIDADEEGYDADVAQTETKEEHVVEEAEGVEKEVETADVHDEVDEHDAKNREPADVVISQVVHEENDPDIVSDVNTTANVTTDMTAMFFTPIPRAIPEMDDVNLISPPLKHKPEELEKKEETQQLDSVPVASTLIAVQDSEVEPNEVTVPSVTAEPAPGQCIIVEQDTPASVLNEPKEEKEKAWKALHIATPFRRGTLPATPFRPPSVTAREDHPNDVESDVVSQHDALPTEAEEREEHHVDDNDSVTPVDAAPHSPKTPQTTTAEAAHSAAEKLNQTLKVKSISIRSRTEFQKYKMLAGSARPPRVEQPPTPISSTADLRERLLQARLKAEARIEASRRLLHTAEQPAINFKTPARVKTPRK